MNSAENNVESAENEIDSDTDAGNSDDDELWCKHVMEVVENYIVEEDLPPLNATDPVGPRNIPDGTNRSPLALWKQFITDDMIYRCCV